VPAAALAAALLGVLLGPAPSAAAAVRPVGPLSPATGTYLGAMTNPDRSTTDSTAPEVAALEASMGRKLAVVNQFYAYPELVTGTRERAELAEGRIPMITWGASDTIALANGSQDAYLHRQARSVAAIGGSVFLRFFHEMEGGYRASYVHSPANLVAAWRHVHAVFAAEGATNVVWVWCPTAWSFTATSNPGAYYPGDDVVDWVASDGYNWAPAQPGAAWRTFSQVFSRWYAWGVARGKPLMIAEFGAQEDPAVPGRKAQWLRDALTSLRTGLPLVQAAVYFDTTHPKATYDLVWDLRSSQSALDAWVAIGQDPYLSPMPPAQTPGPGLPGPYEYVTNPGFDADLNGWAGRLGPAVVTRDPAVGATARGSAVIRPSSTASATVGISDSPAWVVDTVAGQPYTATVRVTASRPNQKVGVRLREVRGGTVLATVTVTKTVVTPGTWVTVTVGLTPTRAGSALALAVSGTLAPADRIWLDDASLVGP
jgi:hypothetical protein